jgi:hypothetical protein
MFNTAHCRINGSGLLKTFSLEVDEPLDGLVFELGGGARDGGLAGPLDLRNPAVKSGNQF